MKRKKKLYNGEACFYTDVRYTESRNNFYGSCYLYNTRWYDISLKSCIRKTLSCRNIPVGTVVEFRKSWYIPKKKIDLSYNFKIKKENLFEVKYEINDPRYFDNFKTCEFSKKLTDALRNNGFIVSVDSSNQNFISGMLSTAAAYKGNIAEPLNEEGETAIAYGHGLKIGFSSQRNTLYGYSYGEDNILFDKFGEFDKWSRCRQIRKNTPINEIIQILLNVKNENDEINKLLEH
jgi:hypothetical protein